MHMAQSRENKLNKPNNNDENEYDGDVAAPQRMHLLNVEARPSLASSTPLTPSASSVDQTGLPSNTTQQPNQATESDGRRNASVCEQSSNVQHSDQPQLEKPTMADTGNTYQQASGMTKKPRPHYDLPPPGYYRIDHKDEREKRPFMHDLKARLNRHNYDQANEAWERSHQPRRRQAPPPALNRIEFLQSLMSQQGGVANVSEELLPEHNVYPKLADESPEDDNQENQQHLFVNAPMLKTEEHIVKAESALSNSSDDHAMAATPQPSTIKAKAQYRYAPCDPESIDKITDWGSVIKKVDTPGKSTRHPRRRQVNEAGQPGSFHVGPNNNALRGPAIKEPWVYPKLILLLVAMGCFRDPGVYDYDGATSDFLEQAIRFLYGDEVLNDVITARDAWEAAKNNWTKRFDTALLKFFGCQDKEELPQHVKDCRSGRAISINATGLLRRYINEDTLSAMDADEDLLPPELFQRGFARPAAATLTDKVQGRLAQLKKKAAEVQSRKDERKADAEEKQRLAAKKKAETAKKTSVKHERDDTEDTDAPVGNEPPKKIRRRCANPPPADPNANRYADSGLATNLAPYLPQLPGLMKYSSSYGGSSQHHRAGNYNARVQEIQRRAMESPAAISPTPQQALRDTQLGGSASQMQVSQSQYQGSSRFPYSSHGNRPSARSVNELSGHHAAGNFSSIGFEGAFYSYSSSNPQGSSYSCSPSYGQSPYSIGPTYAQAPSLSQNAAFTRDVSYAPYHQNATYGQNSTYGQTFSYGQHFTYGQDSAYFQSLISSPAPFHSGHVSSTNLVTDGSDSSIETTPPAQSPPTPEEFQQIGSALGTAARSAAALVNDPTSMADYSFGAGNDEINYNEVLKFEENGQGDGFDLDYSDVTGSQAGPGGSSYE